jgi:hypothetical protein
MLPSGDYVVTDGDAHTLYGPDDFPIRSWKGADEAHGTVYQRVGDQGHYIGTTGTEHVEYDAQKQEVASWTGDDPHAAGAHYTTYGSYAYDGQGHVTGYVATTDGTQTTYSDVTYDAAGQTTGYLTSTGNEHVRYGAGGQPIESWIGTDPHAEGSKYTTFSDYTYDRDGNLTGYTAATGTHHLQYGAGGVLVSSWEGDDPHAQGSGYTAYSVNPDGGYTAHYDDGSSSDFDQHGHRTTTNVPGQDPISWDIDLTALATATYTIAGLAAELDTQFTAIGSTFTDMEGDWDSPSGDSFKALNANFSSAAGDMRTLLTDAVARMQKSYLNYLDAENQNYQLMQ